MARARFKLFFLLSLHEYEQPNMHFWEVQGWSLQMQCSWLLLVIYMYMYYAFELHIPFFSVPRLYAIMSNKKTGEICRLYYIFIVALLYCIYFILYSYTCTIGLCDETRFRFSRNNIYPFGFFLHNFST